MARCAAGPWLPWPQSRKDNNELLFLCSRSVPGFGADRLHCATLSFPRPCIWVDQLFNPWLWPVCSILSSRAWVASQTHPPRVRPAAQVTSQGVNIGRPHPFRWCGQRLMVPRTNSISLKLLLSSVGHPPLRGLDFPRPQELQCAQRNQGSAAAPFTPWPRDGDHVLERVLGGYQLRSHIRGFAFCQCPRTRHLPRQSPRFRRPNHLIRGRARIDLKIELLLPSKKRPSHQLSPDRPHPPRASASLSRIRRQ